MIYEKYGFSIFSDIFESLKKILYIIYIVLKSFDL